MNFGPMESMEWKMVDHWLSLTRAHLVFYLHIQLKLTSLPSIAVIIQNSIIYSKCCSLKLLGADVIECDVGVTKDKELVCLHDAYLSKTTNVASISKFNGRKQWRNYEGVPYNDWWVVDFTLEELKDSVFRAFHFEFDAEFDFDDIDEKFKFLKVLVPENP